jgi:hypothetical protein
MSVCSVVAVVVAVVVVDDDDVRLAVRSARTTEQ